MLAERVNPFFSSKILPSHWSIYSSNWAKQWKCSLLF